MIISAEITSKDTNPAIYHAKDPGGPRRGDHEYAMSYSRLKDFDRCPARWMAGYESPDSDSRKFGNALDAYVLTPHQFGERYAIQPDTYTNDKGEEKPWSNNANVCRAWNESQEQAGIEVLKQKHVAAVADCAKSLRAHRPPDSTYANGEFLDACDKQVAINGFWRDKATSLDVPIRCLIDLAPKSGSEFEGVLADLKTTRCAHPQIFKRFAFQMGYHIQAAVCLALWNAATGEKRNSFCLMLVENFPPWQPGRELISPELLGLGQQEFARQMGRYCGCLKRGTWPGYDDRADAVQGWSVLRLEPWMEAQAFFAESETAEELPF